MIPVSGARMPAIRLRNVVFPEPLSPLKATCSSAPRSNEETSTTVVDVPSGERYDFLSSRISSSAMTRGDCSAPRALSQRFVGNRPAQGDLQVVDRLRRTPNTVSSKKSPDRPGRRTGKKGSALGAHHGARQRGPQEDGPLTRRAPWRSEPRIRSAGTAGTRDRNGVEPAP
jgi:hypothetical protein